MIPTHRRLEYARGYIELGMFNEASDELEAIGWEDRLKLEVLAVRCELYLTAKRWDMAADMARALAGGVGP